MSFTGKPQTFLETIITNDGFFPDVTLGELQKMYRVPAEYLQETVEHHLSLSIDHCNEQLAEQKELWLLSGADSLADVEAKAIKGESVLVLQYKRAVFTHTMAVLVRAFATLNRKPAAEQLSKESVSTEAAYFTASNHAIHRLMGLSGTITAELL